MICTDKLSEGIKRANCPQDTLRGFTGSIIIQDWRGYNQWNPNPEYEKYVEVEAERYTIQPSYESEVRDDNLTLFTHTLTFTIKNNSDVEAEKLAGWVNIPLIISLKTQDGSYLTLFEDTGAKLNISSEYHSGNNGMVMISCQHFHKEVREGLPPQRQSLSGVLLWDVNFLVFDDSSNPVEGADVTIDGDIYTTDINGEVTIQLVDGTYNYTVDHYSFDQYNGMVVIDAEDQTVSVNMVPMSTYTFAIRVVEDGTTDVIQGATVTIDGIDSKQTDVDGVASFELPSGTYNYTVEAVGYNTLTGSHNLTEDITSQVSLVPIA